MLLFTFVFVNLFIVYVYNVVFDGPHFSDTVLILLINKYKRKQSQIHN